MPTLDAGQGVNNIAHALAKMRIGNTIPPFSNEGVMKTLSVLALTALCFSNAVAANKCTSPDGKVTYQDAPCAGAAKSAAIEIQPSQLELEQQAKQQWRFSRARDSMTNEVTCFAVSPEVFVGTGYRQIAYVSMQFAVNVNSGGAALTARSRQGDTAGIFHNNLTGLGAKAGDGPFFPFTRKPSQHALGFEQGAPADLLVQFGTAQEVRLRIRFWPYDQSHDLPPISLKGAKQAILAAMQCGTKQ